MGTAIRYLKYEISLIDQEMAVEEVRSALSRPTCSADWIRRTDFAHRTGQVAAAAQNRFIHPRPDSASRQGHRAARHRQNPKRGDHLDLCSFFGRRGRSAGGQEAREGVQRRSCRFTAVIRG
jgi:hypothetical protein